MRIGIGAVLRPRLPAGMLSWTSPDGTWRVNTVVAPASSS
ncbi:MAG: hypothetical protein AVDCRST_MAG75-1504 [uncultured Propionibacteriaceae bacterium]|uniref:Uncharacterized protein n=1 Tax=uncultured Propionibacteriaceae bacterium TaxID=257457 RepID=A0A6J4NKM1_9ACTN|nr:MAG: hypothetical protein AVDCRST_MAG75-1504 [uncultured Propionibacteriaceae bacterium]